MPRENLGTFKGVKTVVSEGVYGFLTGLTYGSIWGLVSPFPVPGTEAAKGGGAFRPAAPFSSLRSVWFNAAIFAPIVGVHSIARSGAELARGTDDAWNNVAGFAVTYGYYGAFMVHSERRVALHNRAVGAVLLAGVLYANVMV